MQDPRLRLRLLFGSDVMFGPGKADLLDHIAKEGSISGAGRAMGMSYKRAWTLVEAMNSAFTSPLVASSRGGTKGGGAHLTETGEAVLKHYRKLEAITRNAGQDEIAAISELLAPAPAAAHAIDVSHGK